MSPDLVPENRPIFAVIDTETTWQDKLLSVGCVVADAATFELVDKKYFIVTTYKSQGGLFTSSLYIPGVKVDCECTRSESALKIMKFLDQYHVADIFAYNALFDYNHLPELQYLVWHDIMKLAAYKQYNHKIPCFADCCKTGKLKRGYGVESILRMLSDDLGYCEKHNALQDALDELRIMELLNVPVKDYPLLKAKKDMEKSLKALV